MAVDDDYTDVVILNCCDTSGISSRGTVALDSTSIHSSTAKPGSYRHALLLPTVSHLAVSDKELPAPPILTTAEIPLSDSIQDNQDRAFFPPHAHHLTINADDAESHLKRIERRGDNDYLATPGEAEIEFVASANSSPFIPTPVSGYRDKSSPDDIEEDEHLSGAIEGHGMPDGGCHNNRGASDDRVEYCRDETAMDEAPVLRIIREYWGFQNANEVSPEKSRRLSNPYNIDSSVINAHTRPFDYSDHIEKDLPDSTLPNDYEHAEEGLYNNFEAAKENSPSGRPSISEKLDYRTTARWLRSLLKTSESSNPRLTRFPDRMRKKGQSEVGDISRKDSMLSRDLTRRSTARRSTASGMTSSTLTAKFQSTVERLEGLINEAMALANEVVEQHEDESSEGWPTRIRSANEGQPPRPGMYSGNIAGPIPRRISSILKMQDETAWAGYVEDADSSPYLPMPPSPRETDKDKFCPLPHVDGRGHITSSRRELPNSLEVREFIKVFHKPPIHPRESSLQVKDVVPVVWLPPGKQLDISPGARRLEGDGWSLDGSAQDVVIDFATPETRNRTEANIVHAPTSRPSGPRQDIELQERDTAKQRTTALRGISLRGRSHISLQGTQGFSLARSHRRRPLARDWSPIRKRFVATVACISTALVGILVGIYAGLVPSIQYYIADLNHYAILGNVVFYFGLAIPSFFFWPLPLLHGRKPYILSSLAIALPLLFPQAISVSVQRSPYVTYWR
jgi:hypothetical protein